MPSRTMRELCPFVNEEVAGALGLSATYKKVSVNVLSENVETFDSMPVSFILESCDGNLKVPFKALIDWEVQNR